MFQLRNSKERISGNEIISCKDCELKYDSQTRRLLLTRFTEFNENMEDCENKRCPTCF